jgi:hypothetical protein
MKAHLAQKPPPLAERVAVLPDAVHRLVHEMLDKDPAARPTMEQVVVRIKRAEMERTQVSGMGPGMLATQDMPYSGASPGGATIEMAAPPRGYAPTQMVGALNGPERPDTVGLGPPRRRLLLLGIVVGAVVAVLSVWPRPGQRRAQGPAAAAGRLGGAGEGARLAGGNAGDAPGAEQAGARGA